MTVDISSAVHSLQDQTNIRVRGVHHLVLNTEDMKMTIDFYSGVLGMPLVHADRVKPGTARGNPPFENLRHYFFDMGNDSLLAFFEIPKGAIPPGDRNAPGTMQHLAFATTPEMAERFIERLNTAGIDILGPVESAPSLFSIYLYDPNGFRLEITWRSLDNEDVVCVVESIAQTKDAALRELRTLHGDLDWLERVTTGFAD